MEPNNKTINGKKTPTYFIIYIFFFCFEEGVLSRNSFTRVYDSASAFVVHTIGQDNVQAVLTRGLTRYSDRFVHIISVSNVRTDGCCTTWVRCKHAVVHGRFIVRLIHTHIRTEKYILKKKNT